MGTREACDQTTNSLIHEWRMLKDGAESRNMTTFWPWCMYNLHLLKVGTDGKHPKRNGNDMKWGSKTKLELQINLLYWSQTGKLLNFVRGKKISLFFILVFPVLIGLVVRSLFATWSQFALQSCFLIMTTPHCFVTLCVMSCLTWSKPLTLLDLILFTCGPFICVHTYFECNHTLSCNDMQR